MKSKKKIKCRQQLIPTKSGICGAEWPSITQLRKERSQDDKGECPRCKGPLHKNWFR